MIQDLKVLDFHAHFPVKGDWFPDYPKREKIDFDESTSRKYGEVWRKAFNFEVPEAPLDDDEMVKKWVADLDEKNIEKIVWVSGGGNQRLANIVAQAPNRFIGFAHHHPDIEHSADVLEIALRDQGLKGYKLLAPDIDTPLDDPKYYPIWEVCQAYDAPVLPHFGLLGAAGGTPWATNISPFRIADISLKFPKVNFVIPHFGCTHFADLLQLAWTRPNVYIDTSGSNQWIRWMPYPLTLEDVIRKFLETVGPSRIIFATDSSTMPRGFAYHYLEEQHKIFRFMNVSDHDLEAIFYTNGANLLHL